MPPICDPGAPVSNVTSRGIGLEVVQEHHRVVAPVVAQREHAGDAGVEHRRTRPSRPRGLPCACGSCARSSSASSPGSRRCTATLTCSKPYGPSAMTGRIGLSALVKPAAARVDHCIGVRRAVALRQREVVAHADLVAVAQHRRAGQREHQAVGQLEAPAVAAAAWARAGAGCRARRAACPARARTRRTPAARCSLGQAAEVELVVVAQEHRPIARSPGAARSACSALDERAACPRRRARRTECWLTWKLNIMCSRSPSSPKYSMSVVGQHVGLGQDDCVALAPLQELAEDRAACRIARPAC